MILIDNLKKTVERFEQYGEIYYNSCLELNNVLETEICNKINYKFKNKIPFKVNFRQEQFG